MDSTSAAAAASAAQARPSVAKLRRPLSVRTRLALLIALAVAVIIGVQAVIEISIFERGVERDVRENARLTALAVADDFELRREPIDPEALARTLREFAFGAPSIRSISIVSTADGGGKVIASTASIEREDAIAAASAAAARRQTISVDPSPVATIVAVPVIRNGQTVGAAVVTSSMGSVAQLRTKGRRVTLWFAPAVVLLLTFIIDLFVRRLIHRPIARIHETMRLAGAGDFSARAPILRDDEICEVAAGLN